MTAAYNEKHISYFKTELEKVRAKPNMYIGPTDDDGVFTIGREVLDNEVDEARAGRNDLVHFFVYGDDFWAHDNGVGIPVKKHPEAKISTLTHVLTALQSSGKMKGDSYVSSIGTHGVGIKCTNALSKNFEVWTFRKDAGGWHYTKFERGVEKVKVKKANPPKLPNGKKAKKGTVVRWTPDEKIFGKSKFPMSRFLMWAELTAYMNPGLNVILSEKGKKDKTWFSKVGISEYLQKRMGELKANPFSKKIINYHSKHLEVAVSFSDAEGDNMEFFTNTVRNVDRGFHADSFYKALFDSLKSYQGKAEYTPSDLREGLVGVLNIKIDSPKFSSQTKEKNVDERAQKPCYEECKKLLEEFWKDNKSFAKEFVTRAAELRKKTADFLKDKKLSRNVKLAQKGLTAKLAGVVGNAPVEERELYLVEGDSAGGCFIGTTHVLLHDGTTISFEEMVKRADAGEKFRGFAFDRTNKVKRDFEFYEPRITKYVTDLIEVELSDGSKVLCTEDHPWMLEDGNYVAAVDLKPNEALQTIAIPTKLLVEDE